MKYSNYLILFLIVLISLQCQSKSDTEFNWPEIKTENKPGTYWWWMGSAVDKENLSYNLKMLSDAGIGNVHVIPIYGVEGEEEKYIDFLSPQWMEMIDYTVKEAGKLKMNVDMSTTTGWPFGGSHVTSDYAASKIVYEKITVTEGEKIEREIKPQNLEAIIAYDVNNHSIDLFDHVTKESKFSWIAPQGKWRIYILTKEGTGQQVKRAAPGNVGLVLDPFSLKGLEYYLGRYDSAFFNYKDIKLRAQYHDSYEYHNANWTNNFFEIFQAENNYDLKNHLPELLDTSLIDNSIKADYRKTLSKLHLEYIKNWNTWSHNHGWITRNEAHGAPANLLDLYAASDIPETETFGSRKFNIPGIRYVETNNSKSEPPNPLILKFASSAAHVAGKPLIASETGTWLREHYKASLSQLKPEIDELFFCGINHIFYHGNAYSPKDASWPGWIFYASTHFEKENTIWRDLKELNNYAARCQSILQKGKPSNDILLYWPIEDLFHSYPELLLKVFNVHTIDWFLDSNFGKLAAQLDKRGFSFDYISDDQLQNVELDERGIVTGGNSYKVIVVPNTKYMPLETWNQLIKYAENGAVILFHETLPENVPGFLNYKLNKDKLNISKSLLKFEVDRKSNLSLANIKKGKIIKSNDIETLLDYSNVKREQIKDKGINYIRREDKNAYYYFFTNLSDKKLDSWVPLSVEFKSAVIFDPLYENRIGVAAVRENNGNTEIYLQLQSGESCIVKTFKDQIIKGNEWKYQSSSNNSIEILGDWKIDFLDQETKILESYSMDKLKSWTEINTSTESFTGTCKYTIKFTVPSLTAEGWILDLGRVCESARVRLNDKNVGTLWGVPFNIRVDDYITSGENTLEIEVTNLSANRIRDLDRKGIKWKKFFFVDINYKKFDASNWSIMESGLLGPVTLTPVKYLRK